MIRFLTQMHPRLPSRGSSIMHHPECLTIVNGSFIACGPPVRNYVEKTDKDHPQRDGAGAREEKQSTPMPGFVNPEPMRSEGLLTQKVKQQIEEHKKKKEKPTLHNPEGRE